MTDTKKVKRASALCVRCSKKCRITAASGLTEHTCGVHRENWGVDIWDAAYTSVPAEAVCMAIQQCIGTPMMLPSIFTEVA